MPNYDGKTKLAFCGRLGNKWKDLADYLQIPVSDQNRFEHGDEARAIWTWLEVRKRLGELPEALQSIDREDLAGEFGPPSDAKPQDFQPQFIDEQIRGLSHALEDAYKRLEAAQIAERDTAVIQQEILSLKRQIREGGQLKAGDLLSGRFRLIEFLGRGGFATIWKGYDKQRRRLVAIKVLHGQSWGSEWDGDRANTVESRLNRSTAVGLYPQGVSPVGALDMSGTVWEWCLNEYNNPRNVGLAGDARRVVRGGSWLNLQTFARAAYRYSFAPADRGSYIGFRLACASPI